MQNLTYSSSDGVSKFYDFVTRIVKYVSARQETMTVTIDDKKVAITPEMVQIGTHKVLQVLNQYKNHTRR